MSQADLAASTEQAMRLQNTLNTPVRAPDFVADAVKDADVVVLTGSVALPDVPLKPGCHVVVLAADELRECPVTSGLLAGASCFSDGPLPFAVPSVASLDKASGRANDSQTTVFFSTGPAFLDLLAAWHVFVGAREDQTLTWLDLEA